MTTEFTPSTIAKFTLHNANLSHWAEIIDEWIFLTNRYCSVTGTDASYWYNERANIGILSSAAWRSGYVSLEEFQHNKIHFDNTDKSIEKNGRCDLLISNSIKSNLIEAKFKWVDMNDASKLQNSADCLDLALKDAQKLSINGTYSKIGVAFIPVAIKSSLIKSPEEFERKIHQCIKDFQQINCDLIAWTFPKETRTIKNENNNMIAPGVFITAKMI